MPRFREILLENSDPEQCFWAAYHIAQEYLSLRNAKKALFYARIASSRAEALERPDWASWSYEQVGRALAAESFMEESVKYLQLALDGTPTEVSVRRASLLASLGYYSFMTGRQSIGLEHLYRSIRMLRRLGAHLYAGPSLLALSHAHLDYGRFDLAIRHGFQALRLGELLGDSGLVKNALYLVGTARRMNGEEQKALQYYEDLQRRFFPEASYLAAFLIAVDVRRLVNIIA